MGLFGSFSFAVPSSSFSSYLFVSLCEELPVTYCVKSVKIKIIPPEVKKNNTTFC